MHLSIQSVLASVQVCQLSQVDIKQFVQLCVNQMKGSPKDQGESLFRAVLAERLRETLKSAPHNFTSMASVQTQVSALSLLP